MRHILYVSGSRADFGPARRVLSHIRDSSDLRLSVLVTGMHLDPVHGETWQELVADGFTIAERVCGRVAGDSLEAMAASVGLYLYGMSQAISRIRPDILLVLGDRGEQLAAAIAAAFQNIPVVHLCGGSISGSIDDSIRHAITKFAHYHLPALEEHARRIKQMGESPECVRVVGLPGGDIRPDVQYTREEVCAEYRLSPDEPYLLVIQHSVTHSQSEAAAQITETLEAVAESGLDTLLANPNDDAGGRSILAKMRQYAGQYSNLKILVPPCGRERFASIMAHAGALVGNSSSGIVEAMAVGLPVVNVGDRQRGRERYACLISVPHERRAIAEAIRKALRDPDYRQRLQNFKSEWVNPNVARDVAQALRELNLGIARIPKPFVDFAQPGTRQDAIHRRGPEGAE